jgi:hypothetical protein
MTYENHLKQFGAPMPENKNNFRITSTTFLDWPQLGFELKEGANDFPDPSSVPEAVHEKLVGFIRSGHVRLYDLRGETPREVTPEVPPLNDDGTAPRLSDFVDDEVSEPFASTQPLAPNANMPSPGAPIPQNVASSQGETGDGASRGERDASLNDLRTDADKPPGA